MTYVKQLMLIGSGSNSIETSEAHTINLEFDLDAIAPVCSFNLPYMLKDQQSTSGSEVQIAELKKYDTVKLYYGEFDNDPGEVSIADLSLIFDGFITSINLSKSKDRFDYKINALGTAGLTYNRNTFYEVTGDSTIKSFIDRTLEAANLTKYITVNYVDVSAGLLPIFVEGGKNVKEVFDDLKSKYAIIITQTGDGTLLVMKPSFLNKDQGTTGFLAWDFDINKGNVFEIDYGDITSNVNAVVVVGMGDVVGVAVDVIGVQNNSGQVNYQSFERYDLFDTESCEGVAQEKLLELQRNYTLTFKTLFNTSFQVGQRFTMIDNDKYDGSQVFMIKKYSVTIDKQDVSCVISGFTYSLTVLPENLVISNTGVADVDVIQLPNKGQNVLWGSLT